MDVKHLETAVEKSVTVELAAKTGVCSSLCIEELFEFTLM